MDGEPVLLLYNRNGVPSGDNGTEAVITCNTCNAKIIRLALKKSWAEESVIEAWNKREKK